MARADERFRYLAESWFMSEPAFFVIFCGHAQVANPQLKCAVRVGQGRLEYNPAMIESMPDELFEETVKIEMIRLFLKHPYQRTPADCSREKMRIASDMALSSFYQFQYSDLISAADFGLPEGKHYEWYLSNLTIESLATSGDGEAGEGEGVEGDGDGEGDGDSDGGGESDSDQAGQALAESAELWEEDECRQVDVNTTIARIKDWGTIPSRAADTIVASTEARIDYRTVLSGFRATVLSSKRILTRMRPNRRSGFDYMGSKREFSTRLLIAVDVSGSVTNDILSNFFSIIVRFFKYGIELMDVVQFDTEIQGSVLSLEKVRKNPRFDIRGRGGTSFQCVFDFVADHPEYDGLIIFTDGYAPEPRVQKRDRVRKVWVCDSEESYNRHHAWMRKTGRTCFLNLK